VQEETEITHDCNSALKKPREQFSLSRFIKKRLFASCDYGCLRWSLRDGAQPSYFLYLTVPPNTIDINIHPKTEIKFDDEHALYAILRASIKHSLGSLTWLQS
jgi:DNA mismatch repair protein MutL